MKHIFAFVAVVLFSTTAFSQIPVISSLKLKGSLYLDKLKSNDTIKVLVVDTNGIVDTLSLTSFVTEMPEIPEGLDTSNIVYINGLTKLGDTIRLGGQLVQPTTFTGNQPLTQSDGTLVVGKIGRKNNPLLLQLQTDTDTSLGLPVGGYMIFNGIPLGASNIGIPTGGNNIAPTANTRIVLSNGNSSSDYKTAIGITGLGTTLGREMFLSSTNGMSFRVSSGTISRDVFRVANNGINTFRRLRVDGGSNLSRTAACYNFTRDSTALAIYEEVTSNYHPALVWSTFESCGAWTGVNNTMSGLPTPNKQFVIDTLYKISGQYSGNFTKNLNKLSNGARIVFKHLSDASYQSSNENVINPGDTIETWQSLQMTDAAMGVDGNYGTNPIHHFSNLWMSLPRNNVRDRFAIYGGSANERFRFSGNGSMVINQTNDTIQHSNLPLSIKSNSAIELPKGTTAERPTSPQSGYYRYNIDSSSVEFFNGVEWVVLAASDISINSINIYNSDGNINENRTIILNDTANVAFKSGDVGFHVNSKLSVVFPALVDAFNDQTKFSGLVSKDTLQNLFFLNGMVNIFDSDTSIENLIYQVPIISAVKNNPLPFEDPLKQGIFGAISLDYDVTEIGSSIDSTLIFSAQVGHKEFADGELCFGNLTVSKPYVNLGSYDLLQGYQRKLEMYDSIVTINNNRNVGEDSQISVRLDLIQSLVNPVIELTNAVYDTTSQTPRKISLGYSEANYVAPTHKFAGTYEDSIVLSVSPSLSDGVKFYVQSNGTVYGESFITNNPYGSNSFQFKNLDTSDITVTAITQYLILDYFTVQEDLTINLPATSAITGQIYYIIGGGTITSGNIVNNLSLTSAADIIGYTTSPLIVGETLKLLWTGTKWYKL